VRCFPYQNHCPQFPAVQVSGLSGKNLAFHVPPCLYRISPLKKPCPTKFQFDVFPQPQLRRTKKSSVNSPGGLKENGIKVWFDGLGCSSPATASQRRSRKGLEHSRVLVALHVGERVRVRTGRRLEFGTFRFRDPLNKERRFLPLRLGRHPHQRLSGAIPLHQLAHAGPRAGVCEAPRSLPSPSRNQKESEVEPTRPAIC